MCLLDIKLTLTSDGMKFKSSASFKTGPSSPPDHCRCGMMNRRK